MQALTYATTFHDLNVLKNQCMGEVILEVKALSRFGKLSREEFIKLAKRAKELQIRVLLEWDILMTEDVFQKAKEEVVSLLPYVDALRVQDPGALHWSLHHTELPLQFIAENGNHNLEALMGWIDLSQGRIERISLSIELSRLTIGEYLKKISIPCELLGFGRILLFYTPRPLLSALAPEKYALNEQLEMLGESEESPHKGFPVVENRHGTFMFHIKEFCLLDYVDELKNMGLGFFRVDQRWHAPSRLSDILQLFKNFNHADFDNFKKNYSQDLMRGFYLVNKTDVLFPKLKNSRLQKREGNYLGEVLEVEKGQYLAIMVKNAQGLKKSDDLKILHPKGEVFKTRIYLLKNLSLEEVQFVGPGEIALIQYVGGVWVKSQVFYHQEED